MTTQQLLEQEFNFLREELIIQSRNLGMRATGNWERELDVDVVAGNGKFVAQIVGEQYTEQLVFGRKPGTMPPIREIELWIQDKGVFQVQSEAEVSSLAFAIALTIKNEGTTYYKQGGTDLLDAVITPKRIQSIIDKVGDFYAKEIASGIVNELKRVA